MLTEIWLLFHSFHGEIVTVRCLEDNSFVKKALGESGAGKVLVVDGGASMNRALLGDNMAKMAIANKWNGGKQTDIYYPTRITCSLDIYEIHIIHICI